MTDLPSSRQVVATPMSAGKTPERAVANRAVAVAIRSSRTPAIEAAADSMVVANKRANCIVGKLPRSSRGFCLRSIIRNAALSRGAGGNAAIKIRGAPDCRDLP